jgi:hypothetical protein
MFGRYSSLSLTECLHGRVIYVWSWAHAGLFKRLWWLNSSAGPVNEVWDSKVISCDNMGIFLQTLLSFITVCCRLCTPSGPAFSWTDMNSKKIIDSVTLQSGWYLVGQNLRNLQNVKTQCLACSWFEFFITKFSCFCFDGRMIRHTHVFKNSRDDGQHWHSIGLRLWKIILTPS